MENKQIVLISHCFMNTHSKVTNYNKKPIENESKNRCNILSLFFENNIGIIQLPCPEMILYGLNRWGHVKDQFNHIHFLKECQNMLLPCVDQLEEYFKNGYDLFGIIGIDRSPSCGIYKTYRGKWKGEISGNPLFVDNKVEGIYLAEERGMLMEILEAMLLERKIEAQFFGYSPMEYDEFYTKISNKVKEA